MAPFSSSSHNGYLNSTLPRSIHNNMSPRGTRPPPPLPLTPLDSFFDASSLDAKQSFPSYARSAAPSQIQIHSQLPPLRKSRSFATSIFTKKLKRSSSKLSEKSIIPRAKSTFGLRSTRNDQTTSFAEARCPSPFTSPRDPPAPPRASTYLAVPDYVSQRRGSATSSSTLVRSLSFFPFEP